MSEDLHSYSKAKKSDKVSIKPGDVDYITISSFLLGRILQESTLFNDQLLKTLKIVFQLKNWEIFFDFLNPMKPLRCYF